jgi:nucleoside-diphosphate-sugar epimerase
MSAFRGSNVWVVGGAGFVGSNLAQYLLKERPCRLTIVDNLLSTR